MLLVLAINLTVHLTRDNMDNVFTVEQREQKLLLNHVGYK